MTALMAKVGSIELGREVRTNGEKGGCQDLPLSSVLITVSFQSTATC